MPSGTVGEVVKHSLLYSYVLSQPLALNVDAYPVLDNKMLLEAEQIQYGEHGEMVRIAQEKLQTLSYYEDKLDGTYGILTEYALKKFQKDHHINVSGKIDKKTKSEIIQKEKQKHIDKLENLTGSVEPGMHNGDVKIIQEALQYFGYYEGEVDGIYGPLTQKGLEVAEDEHDIELTGDVTEEDLRQLFETEDTDEEEENESADEEDGEEKSDEEDDEEKADEKDDNEETGGKTKHVEGESKVNTAVAEEAQSLIGTPYEWGGETETGFDCSGFIQYIYDTEGITTPRTVSETWNFGEEVDEPSVGDLVFFETYQPGPSHMGVYTGNDEFIHASESNGVKVSELDEDYWEERYLGAKRVE